MLIAVTYLFAYFLGGLALALVLPAAIAAGVDEPEMVPVFLVASALIVFVAGAVMLSLRGRERRLVPAERYLLALMLWTLLPAFAVVPLLLAVEGLSLLDAYFQMVSVLTTTGSNVLPPPERLPQSIVFWLCLVQWIGGALTLLVIVQVLAPTGAGGLPEAHGRLIEHGGLPEKRRLVLVLKDMMPIYGGATALCFSLLFLNGLDAFDALCLAFAAVSTGGYAPRSHALGEYLPDLSLAILALFMIYGATSALWHRDLVRGRWHLARSHREGIWLVGLCAVVGILMAMAFYRAAGHGALSALRDGLFTATSLITTTGFEARNASFDILPVTIIVVLVAIGGASFSTAGGIKLFRIGAMLVQSGRELNRLVYPHGVRPARFGGQSYDIQIMKAIWSGFFVFLASGLLLAGMIAWNGVPFEGSLIAALAAFSNAGPIYQTDWAGAQGWLEYRDMSPATRLALCAGMILGRLEIIAAFSLVVYLRTRL